MPQTTPDADALPEDLPPVEPPSAGFIIQLFVIPALIVAAVIGVWALFGQISASDQDWERLVADLRTTNEHRRGRSATALAQMLRADYDLDAKDRKLINNPVIARELSNLLTEQLKDPTAADEAGIMHQAFLARTLRLLDAQETVIPALREAMKSTHDRDVRKNAVASIAVIAGRMQEENKTLDAPELVDELVEITTESDPLLRQLGAFALGLIPGEISRRRLTVLVEDTFDASTRANAAIGLARQGSTAGYEAFRDVLTNDSTEIEHLLALKNVLKAIGELADRWEASQKTELTGLIEPLAEGSVETAIKIEAGRALLALKKAD
ncbi:MAG: hypothetical protein CMJ48_01495 [Planctomycetaceae bacterium]|nr:hypothetical protein [Planctomycetaceae bacterium]